MTVEEVSINNRPKLLFCLNLNCLQTFTTYKKLISFKQNKSKDEGWSTFLQSTSEDQEESKSRTTIKLKYILGNILIQTLTFNVGFLYFISGMCIVMLRVNISRPTTRIWYMLLYLWHLVMTLGQDHVVSQVQQFITYIVVSRNSISSDIYKNYKVHKVPNSDEDLVSNKRETVGVSFSFHE